MRSLKASVTGLERAKQALRRKSLTQKAIANDLKIASWATVSRFFNGKPVDRFIFMDICHALDLDWEAVVEAVEVVEEETLQDNKTKPDAPNPPAAVMLAAVQQQAIAARDALNPRILSRIPRSVVQDKYLPAILDSVVANHRRVIPIVAPAGYGKSTILGDLYDELQQANVNWVGLVLCSTLSLSTGYTFLRSYSYLAATFTSATAAPGTWDYTNPSSYQTSALDAGFGKSLCGIPCSIVAVAEQLTTHYGRGVLLVDTLDLVINREFVPAFSELLRQLLAIGVTIVFTCRDHDYNDYLEPTRERLIGLSQQVNRYSVPNFTPVEIRLAAETFFHKLKPQAPHLGQVFAEQILTLSADNRSLQEIIQNPLLLALLCDLFAQDGNVPPDLTVSKLYQRYWQEKIAYSRVDCSHFAPLAIEKDTLALTIAQVLFTMSQGRLCESVYRDELGIQFTDSVIAAYNDLLSEGVIEHLPSLKLHFFHQTLLEYAIAYWLTRQSARSARDAWLAQLQTPESARTVTFWYPVLRQYLTILDTDSEFEWVTQTLDLTNLGVFGAIAFAAASRDRPDALIQLLPQVLELSEAHQKRFRQALEIAPKQMAVGVWMAMVQLLEQGNPVTAATTAQTMSVLLVRWRDVLAPYWEEALAAIVRRRDPENSDQLAGDRATVLGWLLYDLLNSLQAQSCLAELAILRQYYLELGSGTCAKVIALHQQPIVPIADRMALLQVMLTQAVPNDSDLETTILDFLVQLLPTTVGSDNLAHWQSWVAVLQRQDPKGWDTLQSRAVGWCVAENIALLSEIASYFEYPDRVEPRRISIALSEAVRQGAAAAITQVILELPIEQFPLPGLSGLASLIRLYGTEFAQDDQERLAQRFLAFLPRYPDRICPVMDRLADASPTARQALQEFVPTLPPEKQIGFQGPLLRFLPIEQHPPLLDLEKSPQLFMVKLYQTQAVSSDLALAQLLAATESRYKEVAVAASSALIQIASLRLSVQQVLSLLRSQFPGVRLNGLLAIYEITQQGEILDEADLTLICTLLGPETNQAVVRHLVQLVTRWVRLRQRVPEGVTAAVSSVIPRLAQKGTLDGGSARLVVAAMKAIAQMWGTGHALTEGQRTETVLLCQGTLCLLTEIDLKRVMNSESEVIDLLSALHRLAPQFIIQLVREYGPLFADRQWTRTLSAILKAIARIESHNSPLIAEVMASTWCSPAIEAIVLEMKGV